MGTMRVLVASFLRPQRGEAFIYRKIKLMKSRKMRISRKIAKIDFSADGAWQLALESRKMLLETTSWHYGQDSERLVRTRCLARASPAPASIRWKGIRKCEKV